MRATRDIMRIVMFYAILGISTITMLVGMIRGLSLFGVVYVILYGSMIITHISAFKYFRYLWEKSRGE